MWESRSDFQGAVGRVGNPLVGCANPACRRRGFPRFPSGPSFPQPSRIRREFRCRQPPPPRVVLRRFVWLVRTPLDGGLPPDLRLRLGDLDERDLAIVAHHPQAAVAALLDEDSRARTDTLVPLGLQLQETVFEAHHQVVAHHPFVLQTKHSLPVPLPRRAAMKVRSRRRLAPELGVMLGQILLVEITVRRFVIGDALQSHLLHEPVLMRAVVAFHAALRLRR